MADIYGPVASRRLGLSLGINHLPPKTCTYSCIYCQLGRTNPLTIERDAFSDPQGIFQAVKDRLEELSRQNRRPDALTFVSNGEPTLDKKLGEAIQLLKPLKVPVVVITNASLIWQAEVRDQLLKADIVSIKVDSINENTWRRINRPHKQLKLTDILNGIRAFALVFKGKILAETMLVRGLNDSEREATHLAAFIKSIAPDRAYLALPLRPPAEKSVQPPRDDKITAVYHIYKENIDQVEILADLPISQFSPENDALQKLLDIIKVHPLEMDEVQIFLKTNNLDIKNLNRLFEKKIIKEQKFRGITYFSHTYSPCIDNH